MHSNLHSFNLHSPLKQKGRGQLSLKVPYIEFHFYVFFDITVPLVNNTLKLYIKYTFARYYKASNLISMQLFANILCHQIHQSQILC